MIEDVVPEVRRLKASNSDTQSDIPSREALSRLCACTEIGEEADDLEVHSYAHKLATIGRVPILSPQVFVSLVIRVIMIKSCTLSGTDESLISLFICLLTADRHHRSLCLLAILKACSVGNRKSLGERNRMHPDQVTSRFLDMINAISLSGILQGDEIQDTLLKVTSEEIGLTLFERLWIRAASPLKVIPTAFKIMSVRLLSKINFTNSADEDLQRAVDHLEQLKDDREFIKNMIPSILRALLQATPDKRAPEFPTSTCARYSANQMRAQIFIEKWVPRFREDVDRNDTHDHIISEIVLLVALHGEEHVFMTLNNLIAKWSSPRITAVFRRAARSAIDSLVEDSTLDFDRQHYFGWDLHMKCRRCCLLLNLLDHEIFSIPGINRFATSLCDGVLAHVMMKKYQNRLEQLGSAGRTSDEGSRILNLSDCLLADIISRTCRSI